MYNYFFKTINAMKTADERLVYFYSVIERKKAIISNLEQFSSYLKTRYPDYNKTNKDEIKWLADRYLSLFKDYRSAIIKSSKKADLIDSIITVHNRMIKTEQEFFVEADEIEVRLKKDLEKSNKRKIGAIILNAISSQREEYVRSHETVNEGIRNWDCLVSLVEDGTVGLAELPSYGIETDGLVLHESK